MSDLIYPKILLDSQDPTSHIHYYEQLANSLFKTVLGQYPDCLIGTKEECYAKFIKELPLLHFAPPAGIPGNLAINFLCPYGPRAFKFFFELLTRWLVPGKRLNVELFFAIDLQIPTWGPQAYTMAEVIVRIEQKSALQTIFDRHAILQRELKLGVSSAHHATRILELKNFITDEKVSMVQDSLNSMLQRHVKNIDDDILGEMQLFLLSCSEEFQKVHEHRDLARLICYHYLFRKTLKQIVQERPDRRHLLIKCTKILNSDRPVLGLLIAMNLLTDYELFEEKHLQKAIHSLIGDLKVIPGSFLRTFLGSSGLRLLYIELERPGGSFLSSVELKKLRKALPGQIRAQIETLIHPTFMPRNEEEIMRHILTLSRELKFTRDPPEMILSLDSQTHQSLSFTVILVRLLKKETLSLWQIFAMGKPGFEFMLERTRVVGTLRNKYPKEASVFFVRIQKDLFLREDHCIDLFRARQTIFEELTRILGPIRDFNGGMIAKQSELFAALKMVLGGIAQRYPLILSNFFYALNPTVMRSILEPKILKPLFLLLLDSIEDGVDPNEPYLLRSQQLGNHLLLIICTKTTALFPAVMQAVDALLLPSLSCAHFSLTVQETHALGYLYTSQEVEKLQLFYDTVLSVMESFSCISP